jgi:hypothetical protein
MPVTLTTHHFLFTARVVTLLDVDNYSGAALRGSFFDAVWKRFCTNKAASSCGECPIHTLCPVSALVAPLREENVRGRDIPRPYVILPPLGKARRYLPGEMLIFGITLIGSIVELLPYIILSIEMLEAGGLGKRSADNRGQRGRFRVQRVEAYHPFTSERQIIYEEGKPKVEAPGLSITEQAISKRAQSLSPEQLTLNFLTPTRITTEKHLQRSFHFFPFLHRLMERLISLEQVYGSGEHPFTHEQRQEFLRQAETIRCLKDETEWEDLTSYSNRQQRVTPLGGFIGKATVGGELASFRELLAWGEVIHLGKSVVKGNGWYTIDREAFAATP